MVIVRPKGDGGDRFRRRWDGSTGPTGLVHDAQLRLIRFPPADRTNTLPCSAVPINRGTLVFHWCCPPGYNGIPRKLDGYNFCIFINRLGICRIQTSAEIYISPISCFGHQSSGPYFHKRGNASISFPLRQRVRVLSVRAAHARENRRFSRLHAILTPSRRESRFSRILVSAGREAAGRAGPTPVVS